MFVGFPVWRSQSTFMVITIWENCNFTVRLLDVSKFIIKIPYHYQFPIKFIFQCRFEDVSLIYFGIEIL
jgi:hypothetical protein